MNDEQGPKALWAPWRLSYLESLDDEKPKASERASSGCFLLDYWQRPEEDERNHVVLRTGEGMVLLNGFPYANGHLLVALGEGRGRLMEYEAGQRAALWGLVERAMVLMEEALSPQGVNVGVNQGRAAGAAGRKAGRRVAAALAFNVWRGLRVLQGIGHAGAVP